MSLSHLGKESKKRGISFEILFGIERAKTIKNKLRLIRIEQKQRNGNNWPSYNESSIIFFKCFDEINNTNGQYATNPKEFYIKELGYYPDYINFDLKLIVEIDESFHFDKNGYLREKDVYRQKEIQNFYFDFKFIRFTEKQMKNILEELFDGGR